MCKSISLRDLLLSGLRQTACYQHNNGRMYVMRPTYRYISDDKPCRQSCVCGPTHVVPLQTRCHDCVVLLQLTVVRSPVLSTQASAGGSRLAQPTAAQHITTSSSISRQHPSMQATPRFTADLVYWPDLCFPADPLTAGV